MGFPKRLFRKTMLAFSGRACFSQGPAKGGGFKRGAFLIRTCPSLFVLLVTFFYLRIDPFPSGTFPIRPFLFLGPLEVAPTRNIPERVRDTILGPFPKKWGTPRFGNPLFTNSLKLVGSGLVEAGLEASKILCVKAFVMIGRPQKLSPLKPHYESTIATFTNLCGLVLTCTGLLNKCHLRANAKKKHIPKRFQPEGIHLKLPALK